MAGFCVDTNQDRISAHIIFLQRGGKLKRVGRHHTIVMISSRYQSGRVNGAGFQCGQLPAASGSFAWNDHNGGVTVVGLWIDNCSAPQEIR